MKTVGELELLRRLSRISDEAIGDSFRAVRAGMTETDLAAALKKFGELGLPPISFVGHGIGLHLHEEPYLGKYSDSRLEAGMVLGIEPLVYNTGMGFGLQLKDMVAVTETGCELLSDRNDTNSLFVIS